MDLVTPVLIVATASVLSWGIRYTAHITKSQCFKESVDHKNSPHLISYCPQSEVCDLSTAAFHNPGINNSNTPGIYICLGWSDQKGTGLIWLCPTSASLHWLAKCAVIGKIDTKTIFYFYFTNPMDKTQFRDRCEPQEKGGFCFFTVFVSIILIPFADMTTESIKRGKKTWQRTLTCS